MQKLRALLLALASTTLALAGCTGSSSDGFTVKAGDALGTYVFTAGAGADNYTWDLGDHLTTAYGKSVTHTYDFTNGNITVTLKAKTGTETKQTAQSLVVGTGKNEKAVFIMEAQTDWGIIGEPLKFSASRSHDPESDPLRYSWSCLRTADAVRLAPHYHPPLPGTNFATAPAGSVTAAKATGPLPAADTTYTGDFCDALGTGTAPSTHATTIQGTFTRTGKYTVFLLASDPVHPTVSGSFNIIVTKPDERPSPTQVYHFTGKFQGGASGTAQQACTTGSLGTCDAFDGSFQLPLNGSQGNVTMTYDAGAAAGLPAANKVTWSIKNGPVEVAKGSGATPETVELLPARLTTSVFNVHVQLDQGRDTQWDLVVTVQLNMDPTNIY